MRDHTRSAGLIAAVAMLVAAPLAAQDPAPPAPDVAGTYTLAQVDDAELPVQFAEEAECRSEITGATLTLEADNTWVMEAQVRKTCGETVEETSTREEGRYALTDEGIDFDPDDDPDVELDPDDVDIDELATATIGDGELRVMLEEAPMVLVFRR